MEDSDIDLWVVQPCSGTAPISIGAVKYACFLNAGYTLFEAWPLLYGPHGADAVVTDRSPEKEADSMLLISNTENHR